MKSIFLILLFFTASTQVNAQHWLTDIVEAKIIAASEQKNIILVFQGSDWCAPCMKLDREVFSTDTFQLYAKDHFVMLQADFPRKKKNALPEEHQKKNNALAEKYNPRGIFPFVIVLDEEGNKLGETGYFKSSPSSYILHLESFKG